MKRRKIHIIRNIFPALLSIVLFISFSSNPPDGNTGAPGDALCSDCHAQAGVSLTGSVSIMGLPSNVAPGSTHNITVRASTNMTAAQAGFQLVALDGNNENIGTLSNPSASTAITTSGSRTYAEHNPALPFGGGNAVSWTFQWTAPNTSSANVTMYAAAIIGDGEAGPGGDRLAQSATSASIMSVPDPLMVSILASANVSCNGANDGSATAQATGGTPPYNFSWSTGATSATATNLPPGTHTVTVNSADGQSTSTTVMITQPAVLTVNLMVTNETSPGANDGVINASPIGGTAPFTYSWSNNQNTASINNLSPGDYTLTVTDNNQCTTIQTATVGAAACAISAEITTQNVDCNGNATGSAMAVVSNGVAPLTYLWSTGETSASISDLAAGNYTVEVTDANNCNTMASAQITEPEFLFLDVISTDENTAGANDGTATALASGGTSPYSFAWSNGASGDFISGLSPDNYIVTVTDNNGCTSSQSFTINSVACNISVEILGTDISCNGSEDGQATTVISGGTAPFSYAWSNGATGSNLNNLSAGTYTVTVSDATACTAVSSAIILEPTPLNISVTATGESSDGANDGTATANSTGGTAPYTFAWSNGDSDMAIQNLSPGDYTVTVSDNNGCTTSTNVTVTAGDVNCNMMVSITTVDVFCNGGSDGSASVEVSGGMLPFDINWSNGSMMANNNGLLAGNISVTVTDVDGCAATASGFINEPTTILVSLTANAESSAGANDGSIMASVSGGTGTYNYAWSNGSTTANLSDLAPGNYSLTVSDANNCTTTESAIVVSGDLQCDLSIAVNTQNTSCGQNTGQASADVSGGTPPYSIEWSNGGADSGINNLAAGTYTVSVSDAAGCMVIGVGVIGSDGGVLCSIEVLSAISAPDAMDGALQAIASNGNGNYTYLWNNGATSPELTGLGEGDYSVNITDESGCTCSSSISLVAPSNETISIGDFVWKDRNRNGLQDVNEGGVEGIFVRLLSPGDDGNLCSEDDVVEDIAVTDEDGFYEFENVKAGFYTIMFEVLSLPAGTQFTTANVGEVDSLDSDAETLTGIVDPFTIEEGQASNLDIDAGIYDICDPLNSGGEIGGSSTSCGTNIDDTAISNVEFPAGGHGEIEYIWLKSSAGNPPSIIPGANEATYVPGTLYETTYFMRRARRTGCIAYHSSNVVIKEVQDFLPAIIDQSPRNLCVNQSGSFEGHLFGLGENFAWDFGAGASPATSSARTVESVIWNSAGLKTVRLTMTNANGCTHTTTVLVNISVCNSASFASIEVVGKSLEEDPPIFNIPGIHNSASDAFLEVELFPNPVQERATLRWSAEAPRSGTVRIFNAFGQLVQGIDFDTNRSDMRLDFSSLPAGLFFIKMNSDNGGEAVLVVRKVE